MKLKKKWLLLAAVAVLAPTLYWWLFLESHVPVGRFEVDLTAVRTLAASMPGDRPSEVRIEKVCAMSFPNIAAKAGAPWSDVLMSVYSYQVRYPNGAFGVIDTAMDEKTALANRSHTFHPEAWKRLSDALHAAEWIVVTHEHYDHLAGLAVQTELKSLFPKMKITREQLEPKPRGAPAEWAPGALDGFTPLACDKYCAIAPGVVLIKAAGHTPGTQLIFVQRGDGTEYLFLGDIAWRMENVREVTERARAVTLAMKEDRDAVQLQLQELNRLQGENPKLVMVPGHETEFIDGLTQQGRFAGPFQ